MDGSELFGIFPMEMLIVSFLYVCVFVHILLLLIFLFRVHGFVHLVTSFFFFLSIF